MASILKTLGRPRVGLVVMMLFLVVGFFPESSIQGADAAVKCHVTPSCYENDEEEKVLDCAKPLTPESETTDCPSGYCYHRIQYAKRNEKPYFASTARHCATYGELACLQKERGLCGGCLKFSTGANRLWAHDKCVDETDARKGGSAAGGRSGKESMETEVSKGPVVYTGEACVCMDKDALRDSKCTDLPPFITTPNDTASTTPTSESTGVKHLGYNIALVGALLVLTLFVTF